MNRVNYFFERAEFKNAEIKKPYYLYKGYCVETENGPYHPVVLHFGKDEIVISYRWQDGRINKVFSLYVADGELNQKMLTKKIESYWKMPLWPLSRDIFLKVDKTLLSISYFSSLYEFDVVDDKFKYCKLFERANSKKELKLQPEELRITYLAGKNKKTERWCIEAGDIYTCNINFRKILLDFLYELDYTNTFEDTNFFKLQPALQNNTLLDALSRKCRYLDELYKLRGYRRRKANETLPKKFRDAEKAWLKILCFNKTYLNVFISADSIFDNVEKELESVLFRSRIGFRRQKRSKLFRKEDSSLRNQSATFFLRRYSLYNAFRTLLHPAYLIALTLLFFLIPFGDLFLDKFAPAWSGLSSIGLPLLMLLGMILYYGIAGINLFKLLLPRLFLGIMLGWSVFWSTEEVWKSALIANANKIIVVNGFLLTIICLYIFTDIRNKLIRVNEVAVLRRTALLLMFAMLISFVQGFYVIQFKAKAILENSSFLEKINPEIFQPGVGDAINKTYQKENPPGLDKVLGSFNKDGRASSNVNDSASYSLYNGLLGSKLENFKTIKILFGKYNLRYIWSVLLSQFIMSILIGIVLQLLWEDRPITEPL